MKLPGKLSVVLPVYNVEAYLEECLRSIATQTLTDLEVIMVDDGSTDGSTAIAEAWAGQDSRFRLVRQENQGLGPARNTGAAHATGEYLVFADSDDVIPADAYQAMVASLEETGSDFAAGKVRRLEPEGGTVPSSLHKVLRPGKRLRVADQPKLLRDRTAWNKVYRRTFWDKHDYLFPAGWYEDSPVTVPAYVAADAFDVIDEVVYLWRRRADSISEARRGVDNLQARFRVMQDVRDVLPAEFQPVWDDVLLDVDLDILYWALPELSRPDRETLATQVAPLIAAIDPALIAKRHSGYRLALRLIADKRLPELHQTLDDRAETGVIKTVRRGERWFVDYPFADDSYEMTKEIKPFARIDRAWWSEGKLRVRGRARLTSIPAESVEIWLRPVSRIGKALKLKIPTKQLDKGFEAVIDPARLKLLGIALPRAEWKLSVALRAEGLYRKESFGCSQEALEDWPKPLPVSTHRQLTPVGSQNRFRLRYQPR